MKIEPLNEVQLFGTNYDRVLDDDDYDDECEMDSTCEYCGGSGGDPLDDGITPCPECDGEGYRWWE